MATRTLTGSCLCGGVSYSATGEVTRFYHCHCSRCRKATGTGHASNVFMEGTLTFDSGADLIASFKVPDAERFSNTFCSTCGARLPRSIQSTGMVFIPAGSLDVEPGMEPQARIFMGSRTEWSCRAGELPEFAAYPG